ncbi:hypothetical protein [Pseudomonas fluvialis]|uniref:hypothetical protein n=1 Tax=Pseudomonas fluvialis TaxID=1793966 RepID=UPI0012FF47A0|nr:hypothetical protein [Pseudomonas pharmacofabricae]
MPAFAQDKQIEVSAVHSPLDAPSFLGIGLDEPFPGEIQKCPKHELLNAADANATSELGHVCYFPKSEETYKLHNTPNLGFGYTLEIMTFQEKPLIFNIKFGNNEFNNLAEIFTERYGPAYRSFTKPLQTGEGKIYSSRVHQWKSSGLEIRLDEIGEDIRWGEARIENVELRSVLDAEIKSSAKEAASKL